MVDLCKLIDEVYLQSHRNSNNSKVPNHTHTNPNVTDDDSNWVDLYGFTKDTFYDTALNPSKSDKEYTNENVWSHMIISSLHSSPPKNSADENDDNKGRVKFIGGLDPNSTLSSLSSLAALINLNSQPKSTTPHLSKGSSKQHQQKPSQQQNNKEQMQQEKLQQEKQRYGAIQPGSLDRYLTIITPKVEDYGLNLQFKRELKNLGISERESVTSGMGRTSVNMLSEVLNSVRVVEINYHKQEKIQNDLTAATASTNEEVEVEMLPDIARALIEMTKQSKALRLSLGYTDSNKENSEDEDEGADMRVKVPLYCDHSKIIDDSVALRNGVSNTLRNARARKLMMDQD